VSEVESLTRLFLVRRSMQYQLVLHSVWVPLSHSSLSARSSDRNRCLPGIAKKIRNGSMETSIVVILYQHDNDSNGSHVPIATFYLLNNRCTESGKNLFEFGDRSFHYLGLRSE
jgi:hypothetical protein